MNQSICRSPNPLDKSIFLITQSNHLIRHSMNQSLPLLGFSDGDPEEDSYPFCPLRSSPALGWSLWAEGLLVHSTHRGSGHPRWGDAQCASRPAADPWGTDTRCCSTLQTGWVGYFYSTSSGPLLLRGAPGSTDTVSEFHAKIPQAIVSWVLVQGPYLAVRVGVEPATLGRKGDESTNEPPHPILHWFCIG